MNKPLKQQVVIMATLLGIEDKDIEKALSNCDDALKRHGLIAKRGNPNIKNLAGKVDSDEMDKLVEILPFFDGQEMKSVKQLHQLL